MSVITEHFECGPFSVSIDNLITDEGDIQVKAWLYDCRYLLDTTLKATTLDNAKTYALTWCKERVKSWQREIAEQGIKGW